MSILLGFDIGGTKSAVLVGESHNDNIVIKNKKTIPTDISKSPYDFSEDLCNIADNLLKGEKPCSVGISCGGPLDSNMGVILCPPNLPTWINFPICKILRDRYGVKVNLQNDANACALAENKIGAGKGSENMIFMTFGTGLGAGIIINGELFGGTNGNAGEVGHIRLAQDGPFGYGKHGSFEGFCSGAGIAQLGYSVCLEEHKKGNLLPYFDVSKPLGGLTAKILADEAHKGDDTAVRTYEICGEYLGKGISILIDILNPDTIVIGSVFARSGDLLIPTMKKYIEREALEQSAKVCKIVPALLGDEIGDYAALITAMI